MWRSVDSHLFQTKLQAITNKHMPEVRYAQPFKNRALRVCKSRAQLHQVAPLNSPRVAADELSKATYGASNSPGTDLDPFK